MARFSVLLLGSYSIMWGFISGTNGASTQDLGLRTLLSTRDHTYRFRDEVPLFANKVGPFHNPR